jgi:hypothetical protein
MLEFKDPIQVITPLGKGRAIFIEITGHDYYWTVILDNCAIVTFTQDKIKACRSYTHNRSITNDEMMNIINA